MKDNSGKRLVVTMVFTFVAMGVNLLINFIATQIITNNIGIEANGFVSLVNTFVNYSIIITSALNSYAARYISIEYYRGNKEKANCYCSSVFFGDLILGGCITFIAFIGIFNLDKILNISPELVTDVKVLFALIFINSFVVTIRPAIEVAAFIKDRLDISAIIKVISYMIQIICLVTLFTFFSPYTWYVGIGTLLASIFSIIANLNLKRKLTPDLRISINYCRIGALKEIILNGLWYSINCLGNMLQSGLDLLISNKMLTALAMGQLSIAKQISNMFVILYQSLSQPFQPTFMKIYAEKNIGELVNKLKFAIKINGLISNLLVAGFIVLGKEFYDLWIPGQDIDFIYRITVISIIGDMVSGAVVHLYYVYTLTVKVKIPSYITIGSGLLSFVSMCILLTYTSLGTYAIVITTMIFTLILNLIFTPIYSAHCLNISRMTFMPTLIKHIISCIVMIAGFAFFIRFFQINTWISLVIMAFLCCVIGAFIHSIIMFDKNEINMVFVTMLKKLGGSDMDRYIINCLKADSYRLSKSYSKRAIIKNAIFKRTFRPICTLRICQYFNAKKGVTDKIFLKIFIVLHKISCNIAGIDLGWKTRIGAGFCLTHGWGTVINESAVIGSNVTIFHGVTIGQQDRINGNGERISGFPSIKDNVWIGPNSVIIGGVTVEKSSIIAPLSMIYKDVQGGTTVGGNPQVVLNMNAIEDVYNKVPLDEIFN